MVSWTDDEPGWPVAVREIQLVARRFRQRWVLILAIVCAFTAVVGFFRARQPRFFSSTVLLRIVEDHFDPDTAPPTPAQLQQHLRDVSLSRHVLLDTISRFHLFPSQFKKDPSLALERMSDAIELSVAENYFSEEATTEDPGRSARVAITFGCDDPDKALEVVRHLASVVAERQRSDRQTYTVEAARSANDVVQELQDLKDSLELREHELTSKVAASGVIGDADSATATVELRRLQNDLLGLEQEIALYEQRSTHYHLRQDFEAEGSGIRIDIVDSGRLAEAALTKSQLTLLYMIAAFFGSLPMVSLAVTIFDSRVRECGGLEQRVGMPPLGQVPAFQGMFLGAWSTRTSKARE